MDAPVKLTSALEELSKMCSDLLLEETATARTRLLLSFSKQVVFIHLATHFKAALSFKATLNRIQPFFTGRRVLGPKRAPSLFITEQLYFIALSLHIAMYPFWISIKFIL